MGFRAEIHGNDRFRIAQQPAPFHSIALLIQPKTVSSPDGTVYVKPAGAMLKIAGYAPVVAESVNEDGQSYRIVFRLPSDLVKTASSRFVAQQPAEMWVPLETGVLSFAGVEHRLSSSMRSSGNLVPAHVGPMTSAAKGAGDFLRGLYQAR